ncbi:MAG: phytoene desaturase family protein [Gemmatimonadota bacterium]
MRVAVIGGGFGGLALAIRLQAAGVSVKLFEKRPRLGGRAYQLQEDGYTFDMGPSLVTAPHILDSVFRAAGRRLLDEVDLVPLDPYYRVFFHDGSSIDYVGDPERMKAQMQAFSSVDAERFDDFMEAIQPIHQSVIEDRLGGRPFDTVGKLLRFVPRMLRMGAHRTVTRFVERFFEDPRHRFLYSFHPLFVGGNPFATPAIYLMIPYLEREGGVWFARGGMYSLVEALERTFLAAGGEIATGTEVDAIHVEGGRARGVRVGGVVEPFDAVVSNADVAHTYGHLLRGTKRGRWSDRRLAGLDYTMSCVVLYLGVRRTYPQLAHHTLILSERYRGLLDDIFRRKVLSGDFSMYLHVPTRTDLAMAPPECESMYVLIPVPHLGADVDWRTEGTPFADRVIAFLEDWGLEGLRDAIEVRRIFTPLDFEQQLNAHLGNAFGLVPRFTQTAWFRPHNRSEDVAGLYLVGAGTHPGAGVPGVLLSAEATYEAMRADLQLPPAWDDREPGRVALLEDTTEATVAGR